MHRRQKRTMNHSKGIFLNRLNNFFITWFGCGWVPVAPGTAGTVGTIPLAYWIVINGEMWHRAALAAFVTLVAVFFVGLDQKWNPENRDPSYVVIDETAGYLWSVVGADVLFQGSIWWDLGIAFVLFRIFDVAKPFPGGWFDRKSKTGKGWLWRGACIVLDDVVAGWYSILVLWLIHIFGHKFF